MTDTKKLRKALEDLATMVIDLHPAMHTELVRELTKVRGILVRTAPSTDEAKRLNDFFEQAFCDSKRHGQVVRMREFV